MAIRSRYSQCVLAAAALVGLASSSVRATLQVLENFNPPGTGGDLAGYAAAQTPPETGLTGVWMNNSGGRFSGNILLTAADGQNAGTLLQYPTNSSLSTSNTIGGTARGSGGFPNPLYTAALTNSIPLSGTAANYYFSFLLDNTPTGENYDAQLVLSAPSTQIYAGLGYNAHDDISVEPTGTLPYGSGNSYNASGKSFATGFSGGYVALVLGELVTTTSGVDTVNLTTYKYQSGSSAPLPLTASAIAWDTTYTTSAETDTVNQLGLFITGSYTPEITAIRLGTTYADAVGTVSAIGLAGTFTTYTGAVNGSFDTSTPNFSFNGSATAFSSGNNVLFDDTAVGPRNVVVTSGGVSPGSVTFNNATSNYNLSGGPITSAGSLTLVAAGTVTLNNSNTYGGGVNISNGTLSLGPSAFLNTTGFSSGAGTLDFSGGTVQASNNSTGFIAGISITLHAAGGTIDTQAFSITVADAIDQSNSSPGGGLTKIGSGTLTLGAINGYFGPTVVNAGTLVLAVGGGNGAVEGPLTINSGATVDATVSDAIGFSAGFSVPVVTVNAGGTFVLAANGLNGGNGNEGYITNLNVAGGTIMATLGGSFNFNTGYNISSIASSTTGTISSDVAIRGSGLTITTAAGTTPSGIDLLISGRVLGGNNAVLNIAGNGTLDLTGSSTYAGGTTITGGTVIAGNSSAFGNPNANINISGATLVLGSVSAPAPVVSFAQNDFVINPGSSTLQLAPTANFSSGTVGLIEVQTGAKLALTIGSTPATGATTGLLTVTTSLTLDDPTNTSKLDIGKVAVDLPGGSLSTITSYVATGFAVGQWTGPGIISSAAAADSHHLTAVGVIANDNGSGTPLYGTGGTLATTFEGGTPTDGDVLLKYTYYGDANLDGKVDGTDYSRIDAAFTNNLNSSNPQLTGWYNGDFNYDGFVNGSDYTLIDNAFNSQGAQFTAQVAAATALIGGTGGTSVPEPTSLVLFGIGSVSLLGRRRRSK